MITFERIVDETCKHLNLPKELIHIKSREKEIIKARQIAMKLCKDKLGYSSTKIGMRLGSKDHATALNAIKKANIYIATEKDYRNDYEVIKYKIEIVPFELLILKILTKYAVKKMGNIPFDYNEVIKDFNRVMSCK